MTGFKWKSMWVRANHRFQSGPFGISSVSITLWSIESNWISQHPVGNIAPRYLRWIAVDSHFICLCHSRYLSLSVMKKLKLISIFNELENHPIMILVYIILIIRLQLPRYCFPEDWVKQHISLLKPNDYSQTNWTGKIPCRKRSSRYWLVLTNSRQWWYWFHTNWNISHVYTWKYCGKSIDDPAVVIGFMFDPLNLRHLSWIE